MITSSKPFALRLSLIVTAVAMTGLTAQAAHADNWGARQEIREGYYEVKAAERKAERRIERCETRTCVEREVRKGYHSVEREKREARREIRRELRKDYR